jgi:hypothetical protein
VTVAVTGTTANVSFTADPTGTSHLVQCSSSTGASTRNVTGTASPIAVTNLTLGNSYVCRVRTTNDISTSAFSPDSTSFTIHNYPTAPTGVSVAVSGTTATVSFAGDPTATSHLVQCSSSTGASTRNVTGTASPIAVTGLSAGHTYVCRVRTTNDIGTGPFSTDSSSFTIQNIPPVPTGVTVTVSGTTATVSFTGSSAATSYLAQCSSTNGGATRNVTGTASPISVTALSAGKTYACRVRASNTIGTSAFSTDTNNFTV